MATDERRLSNDELIQLAEHAGSQLLDVRATVQRLAAEIRRRSNLPPQETRDAQEGAT